MTGPLCQDWRALGRSLCEGSSLIHAAIHAEPGLAKGKKDFPLLCSGWPEIEKKKKKGRGGGGWGCEREEGREAGEGGGGGVATGTVLYSSQTPLIIKIE